jgi:hypothetical protein
MTISITRGDASNETFTKFREENADRTVYNGAAHTFSLRDFVSCSRILPTGNSFPTSRYTVKRTKDITMPDASVRPMIVELSLSMPAGKEVESEALVEDVALVAEQINALIQSLGLPE